MKLYLDRGFSAVKYGRAGKQYRFTRDKTGKSVGECDNMNDVFHLLRDPDVFVEENICMIIKDRGKTIEIKKLDEVDIVDKHYENATACDPAEIVGAGDNKIEIPKEQEEPKKPEPKRRGRKSKGV